MLANAANLKPIDLSPIVTAVLHLYDDDNASNVASSRTEKLNNLFRSQDQEHIEAALDAKQLAADLVAMPKAKALDMGLDAVRATELATQYVRFSECRTAYKLFSTFPDLWAAFATRIDSWNDRIAWARASMKDEREGRKQAQAEEVFTELAKMKGEEVDRDAIKAQIADLAAANKSLKDQAKREPGIVAEALLKSIEAKGANPKAVIKALIEAVYGEGYDVLPVAEVDRLLRVA